MAHIVLVGALPESLFNFRGDLIRALVLSGHQVTAMAAPASADQVKVIESLGATFRSYPVQRNGVNPWRDVLTLLALRKAFDELQPNVVLAYTIKPVIWGGFALTGIPGPRFFPLITGLGFAFHGQGLRRKILTSLVSWLYRVGLARSTGVMFQNSDNRDLFLSRQIVTASKSYVVAGSGVDISRFAVAPFPPSSPIFLLIARLLGEKGLREFVFAARLVKERYPDAIFRLLGPTDTSPDGVPLKEVQGWDSQGVVEYLGEAFDVRPFIADCHVFVLPSFYGEGLPRTIVEAMAMGRPILTTDNVGCRETVVDGENGFLVPVRNSKALSERMIWFIEHQDQWERMGQASRRMAEERFDVRKVNAEMLRIMNLNTKGTAS